MTIKDKFFMDITERTAEQSHCVSKHVGALLVKDGRIISMGYNGTPSGYVHCDRYFLYDQTAISSDISVEEFRSIHHKWSDIHEIHAEMNAIMFAAKNGISVNGATLYCNYFPCQHCLKNLIQTGIKRIVYKTEYDLGQYNPEFLEFIKKNIVIELI